MAFIEESLMHIIKQFGEENTKRVLSDFVCKENEEVESFIREKAIRCEKNGLAKTILIFDSNVNHSIVGYFTITTKSFLLETKSNTTLKKKYFGTSQTNGDVIPSILIGQLGKNEAIKKTKFTGTNLMDFIF